MIRLDGYKKAFLSMPKEILEAEVNGEIHDAVTVFLSDGTLDNVQMSCQKALYLRVSGEKTGYYYTQNLEEDPAEALRIAYDNSFYSEQTGIDNMKKEIEQRCLADQSACGNVNHLHKMAARLAQRALKEMEFPEESIHYSASLKAETYGQRTVNSHGLDLDFQYPVYIFNMDVSVLVDRQTLTAEISLASSDPDKMEIEQAGKELNLKCKAQIGPAERIVPGEYPVILGNSVVFYLFGTGWQMFSGLKYVEGTSCLNGLLGQKIGSEYLKVCDFSGEDGNGFPMFADSEGEKGVNRILVENGILKDLMHNRKSFLGLGMQPTGNAGRRPLLFGNIATDILVTPKNFTILPGTADLDSMIRSMENGVLITESFDIFHTIDIASGDFSIPCRGIMIKDGKPAGILSSMNMTGNMKELMMNIEEIGKEHMLHPMVAIENYGIGTCPIRISRVSLSGE